MISKKINDWEAKINRFLSGACDDAYSFLGAHPAELHGRSGFLYRTWAPNAAAVSVAGDFNRWDPRSNPLRPLQGGIWEGFVPGAAELDAYKFSIQTRDGRQFEKADPYAFCAQLRPGTASRLCSTEGYPWGDQAWLEHRRKKPLYRKPLNIYEVHLGSWRKTGDDRWLNYREIAEYLVPYAKEMGYTHVALLPIAEHPQDESWGYSATGCFAPTSRFGGPKDLMYLVDQLHRAGIGVVLDWSCAWFAPDDFGLSQFDGTPVYEYADPRKGLLPERNALRFDFGRNEVHSFLLSSAMFWLNEYHIDGLRIEAVSDMLYLDRGRPPGDWLPNIHGGNENLEAVSFLRTLNQLVFRRHPDALMIAGDASGWEQVTAPPERSDIALGFAFQWNVGWMNDALHYQQTPPDLRRHNHRDLTFPLMYAFQENYILPISHQAVIPGRGSMLDKMPGSDEERFSSVRAFYLYMMTMPGKKLSFMGTEFGQWREWRWAYSLDWHLLDQPRHQSQRSFFRDLNGLYLERSELWEADDGWEGFQWIEPDDNAGSTLLYLRRTRKKQELVIAVNFSPIHRSGHPVGVPTPGAYEVLLSSDDPQYGGSGAGTLSPVKTAPESCHGFDQSLRLELAPYSGVILRCARKNPTRKAGKATDKQAKTPK